MIYRVEVVAMKAWLGNPKDPLIWAFAVPAESGADALMAMRRQYPGKEVRLAAMI